MPHAPYEVFPYSVEALCLHIERITGTPFHLIGEKRQIKYLNHYLSFWDKRKADSDEPNVRVVVENNYIDQHYLTDYAEYFVKCFKSYPRNCSRMHFFDFRFLDSQFIKNVLSGDVHPYTFSKLQDAYLGYIVIRPIPSRFLAKVCLSPYPHLLGNVDRTLITKEYNASLFGIDLCVNTVAFQEQDRVLAACATSALWSLFQAHKCISLNQVPSAIEITRSAYPDNPGVESLFPNSGLSFEMMCRSVRGNGLEPKVLRFDKNFDSNEMLELIYAYCSGGYPIILGVEVSNPQEKKKTELHAVTILGFCLDNSTVSTRPKKGLKTRATRISKLYVHDDRTGPFARMLPGKLSWELVIEAPKNDVSKSQKESYKPTDLIVGVYHKVRINYVQIKETCMSLVTRLKVMAKHQYRNNKEDLVIFNEAVDDFEWDIKIEEVASVKRRLLVDQDVMSGKEDFLTKNMPKYIWTVKVSGDRGRMFELFFDATDIPEGASFLDVVHYCEESQQIFDVFSMYCLDHQSILDCDLNLNDSKPDHIWGLMQYYGRKRSYQESLDGQYGRLKTPKKIKEDEIEEGRVKDQHPVLIDAVNHSFELNPQDNYYLWVINADGNLLVGRETKEKNALYRGHPTLLQGGLGRIGGEIRYSSGNEWAVNPRSGRYSYAYSEAEIYIYMRNVIEKKFRTFFPNYEFRLDLSSDRNSIVMPVLDAILSDTGRETSYLAGRWSGKGKLKAINTPTPHGAQAAG